MSIKHRWWRFLLILAMSTVFLAGTRFLPSALVSQSSEPPVGNSVIKDGFSIVMNIDPVLAVKDGPSVLREGDDAEFKFTVQDATTRESVKGLHPAVWMARRNPQEETASCQQQIKSYLQGGLAMQAEVNLNAYYILALNQKASISVIDPQKGFGGSKLITRVMLRSPGRDWVMSKDQKKLYVTTPLSREIAVVDTATWKPVAFIDLDAAPKALAMQPDGKYLWVGLASTGHDKAFYGVGVIDTEKNAIVARIETGAGEHDFAFSDDSRFAYISNSDAQTISVISTANLATSKLVETAAMPLSLAFSPLSKSLLVATNNGQLQVIDSASLEVLSNITLNDHPNQLRISNDGRWGFALSLGVSNVFVIDMADNRMVHSIEVAAVPDQITFTDSYAYVHSINSETVSMIQLDAIGKDATVPVTTFPAGQKAPGRTIGDVMAPTPERSSVVVANPADNTIYYYMEGMAAPMGSFDNFGLAPMAVMIMDRSVREALPGTYVGYTKLPPAGAYSAAILLDNPQVFHCFNVTIASSTSQASQTLASPTLDYLMENKEVVAGESIQVKLKIGQPGSVGRTEPVNDLETLIFRIPGMWQQRKLVKPLGDGIYQVEFTPPEAGIYQLFTRSAALKLAFQDLPALTIRVGRRQTADATSVNP